MRLRLSKNSPKRQSTVFFTKEYFCDLKFFFRFLIGIALKLLMVMSFDFLREPHSAVPLYADEYGSLDFVAFSAVFSLIKFHLYEHTQSSESVMPCSAHWSLIYCCICLTTVLIHCGGSCAPSGLTVRVPNIS